MVSFPVLFLYGSVIFLHEKRPELKINKTVIKKTVIIEIFNGFIVFFFESKHYKDKYISHTYVFFTILVCEFKKQLHQ